MRRSFFASVTFAFAICSWATPVRGDGGQIRLSEVHGEYQITVLTSPNPLRAGQVDVSVWIQELASGRSIVDLPVVVEATPRDRGHATIISRATCAAATNKLLQAAEFQLPSPGWWDVRIECDLPSPGDSIVLGFAMEAGPPLPAWLAVWPWYGWPAFVVVLYVVHRLLVDRDQRRTSRMPPGKSTGAARGLTPGGIDGCDKVRNILFR